MFYSTRRMATKKVRLFHIQFYSSNNRIVQRMRWGRCWNFLPVLGGDGMKKSPSGDIFDHPLVKGVRSVSSLPIM